MRGMMFTGVPNMAWVFGYFRASWTLRSELIADFVCRLLKHMDSTRQAHRVDGRATAGRKRTIEARQLRIDPESFSPGLPDARHASPAQRGVTTEWQRTPEDYWNEKDEFPAIDLDDPVFVYG